MACPGLSPTTSAIPRPASLRRLLSHHRPDTTQEESSAVQPSVRRACSSRVVHHSPAPRVFKRLRRARCGQQFSRAVLARISDWRPRLWFSATAESFLDGKCKNVCALDAGLDFRLLVVVLEDMPLAFCVMLPVGLQRKWLASFACSHAPACCRACFGAAFAE